MKERLYLQRSVGQTKPLRVNCGHSILRQTFLIVFIGVLACSCSSHPPPSFAITHVTLIDGTGAPAQPDMTVFLADEQIAAIGPSKSVFIPRETKTLDATGKFLIPGLVDMHAHLTGAGEPTGSREFILPLLLANGITTVRDMGGDLESLLKLRKEIEGGKLQAPRIFFAGPYLDGNPPFFQPSLVVTNSTEAGEDVHSLISRGADFIKVQSNLSRDAYFAIADVCRREHITFVGHVPDRVTASEASDAGQKSIEHLTGVLRACSNEEPLLIRKQFAAGPKNGTKGAVHGPRTFVAARTVGELFGPASRSTDCKIHRQSNLAGTYVDPSTQRRISHAGYGSLARSSKEIHPLAGSRELAKGRERARQGCNAAGILSAFRLDASVASHRRQDERGRRSHPGGHGHYGSIYLSWFQLA